MAEIPEARAHAGSGAHAGRGRVEGETHVRELARGRNRGPTQGRRRMAEARGRREEGEGGEPVEETVGVEAAPPSPRQRRRTLAWTLGPVLAGVGIPTLIIGLNPSLRGEFLHAWHLLWAGEPDALRHWLRGFGFWAPFVSATLQVATSIFPPGPSFLLAIANAMVFGAVLGGLLTFGTALLAAGTCFAIARAIGRPGVARIVSPERLQRMDRFMERRGMLAVFLGRLIPFINPDLVSYAAGVTGIRWFPFLAAMAAGTIPSTLFYTLVGAWAVEATGWVLLAVGVSTLLPLLGLLLYRRRLYRRRGDPSRPPGG